MSSKLNVDTVAKVGVVYQWNVLKNGKQVAQWTTDLTGAGSIYSGAAKTKPGCILTLEDDDLVALANGQLDSMKAFMGGKLKITGNVMLAQKLKALFGEQTAGVKAKQTAVRFYSILTTGTCLFQ